LEIAAERRIFLKLQYYRGRCPNFGDDLNAVLWPALMPNFFDSDDREIFVGIGTIIGFDCGFPRKINVFSSGAGNDRVNRWTDCEVKYWCVRGPLSARVLGLASKHSISDGAVLSPLAAAFPPSPSVGVGVLIIPHWETLDFPGWTEVSKLTGFEILDPRGRPEYVIARISQSRLVLAESLHGAIMADVYGVPWAAFATSGNFQVSKWVDWRMACEGRFEVSIVPPPSPGSLQKYGRPFTHFGNRVTVSEEVALREMERRMAGVRPVSNMARMNLWLKQSSIARRLYRVSPERTAKALANLVERVQEPTSRAVIERQQTRLLEQLSRLANVVVR
jgi:succinoglycan biosynthesis protein ExoV